MSRKFQRTRSSATTYQYSKRQSFFQDEVDQVSKSTIIPFINARFSVVPKRPLNESKKKNQIQVFNNQRNTKLLCHLIFSRVTKFVKSIAGHNFFQRLKLKAFSEITNKVLSTTSKKFFAEAFQKIKLKPSREKLNVKLLQLNFISKRLIHNSLSFGFRKIILVEGQKPQDISKTKKKERIIKFELEPHANQNFYFQSPKLQTEQFQETQRHSKNFPQQLKRDTYQKLSQGRAIWKILPRHTIIDYNLANK